jgi:transglutaminase-like putative cysteine protease
VLSLRRRIGLQDVGQTAFAVATVLAFAATLGRLGWWVVLPFLISFALQLKELPPRLRRGLEILVLGLIVGQAAFAVLWVLYPVIGDAIVEVVPRTVGFVLVPLLVLAHVARPAWPLHRAFYPAGLALLGIACLSPFADVRVWIPAAFGALFVATVTGDVTVARRGARSRPLRFVGMGALAAAASLLAFWIARFLPLAQPLVEQAVAQAMNPSPGTASSGFSDVSNLGDAEELALSRKLVMRVWTDQPRHLRGLVSSRFDGKRWHARRPAARSLAAAPETLPPQLGEVLGPIPGASWLVEGIGRDALASPALVRTKIVQAVVFDQGALFVPAGTVIAKLPAEQPRLDVSGVLRAPGYPPTQIYGVVSGDALLPDAGTDAEDLQLPDGLDPRLGELANSLAAGAASHEDVLKRVLAHLERECVYTRKGVRLASKQPVAEFLFETKRGYCEYFASAAVVLLRLCGIPARYVKGFSMREMNSIGSHYVVRESDSHAWIEAHLPDRGWVEADPTPAAQFEAEHRESQPGLVAAAFERVTAVFAEISLRLRGDTLGTLKWVFWALVREWKAVLAVVGLGALWRPVLRFLRGRRLRFRRWGRRATIAQEGESVSPELRTLVLTLEGRWARGGHPRPPTRGLLDHAEQVPVAASRVPSRDAARAVVSCYYRARFGGVTPEAGEVEALRQML